MVEIYALLEPETRRPRYVGQSRDARKRAYKHWTDRTSPRRRQRNPGLGAWLCSLAERPEYYVFESVPYELRHEAEHYYTDLLRQIGLDLLNVNSGAHLSSDHAAKFQAAGTAALTGRKHTPETIEKMRQRRHSSQTRAAMSAARKGQPKSPETRAKMAAAKKAWWERRAAEETGRLF